MFVFAAYSHFDTPYYKEHHPDIRKFFMNDPESIGFQSIISLAVLIVMIIAIIASIGAQIKDVMGYFLFVLVFF